MESIHRFFKQLICKHSNESSSYSKETNIVTSHCFDCDSKSRVLVTTGVRVKDNKFV